MTKMALTQYGRRMEMYLARMDRAAEVEIERASEREFIAKGSAEDTFYSIHMDDEGATRCTCKDHETHAKRFGIPCKHQLAVSNWMDAHNE